MMLTPSAPADDRSTARRELRVTLPDGVRLAVWEYGDRCADHTVVFVHGLCLTSATWARQIARLTHPTARPVRIIAYDQRGHGHSGHASMSTYRIDQLADDLAHLLAALNVSGHLTLAGHSMGGMVALAYACIPARPIAPAGLVLAATAAGRLVDRGVGRLLATPATTAAFNLVSHAPDRVVHAAARTVCAALGHWHRDALTTAAAATATAALTRACPATAVGFLPSLREFDRRAHLPGIHARTVVLSGGADSLTPPEHGREIAAAIPGAEHIQIPNAGHMLPVEAPAELSAALRRTLTAPATAVAS